MTWIMENLSTILISAGLLAVVSLIVFSMIKNRKTGSCHGGCAGCKICPSNDKEASATDPIQ